MAAAPSTCSRSSRWTPLHPFQRLFRWVQEALFRASRKLRLSAAGPRRGGHPPTPPTSKQTWPAGRPLIDFDAPVAVESSVDPKTSRTGDGVNTIYRSIEVLGRYVVRFLEATGEIAGTGFRFFFDLVRPPFRIRNTFKQMEFVGIDSLVIVLVTGLFTGMVFAVQLYIALSMFGAGGLTGSTVGISLARELSPVFCALMVTGRVGSAMAATVGTMRVTEQIDALEAMAVDPRHYLVVPRVVAAMAMMPLLVLVFDGIGIVGAYLVGVKLLSLDPGLFFNKLYWFVDPDDIWKGMIKGGVFGYIFAVVGCSKGYYTTGGAEGVGRATTNAVVISSVLILISDYFLSTAMW